ncbi:hypothetical protein [Pseudoalteromonas sp. SK20]|uniref:hypothetical protein n=1 Tax=Pseudoalteromonas sp. SK20 TaxID=1938367 RepID=UPI00111566F1|nr:hypothetical protein [Pseudoalteromonas sp. SK20]
MTFNRYWVTYFGVKVLYSFFAYFIYSEFTSLGDTERYLSGEFKADFFYNSTSMMDFVAGTLGNLMGGALANIPFAFLSFYGVYYSVTRLGLNNRQLVFVLALLSFPSFGVWTSVASKEAISVFYLGIIAGSIIDFINSFKVNKKLLIISIYLCLLFKPQYIIGLTSLYIFVVFSRKFKLLGFGKFILVCLFFILSGILLYTLKDQINLFTEILPKHFSTDAASTRENTIWVKENDVFFNAPYGMFIAFFGPTFTEALAKPTHLIVWVESFIILSVFLMACLRLFLSSVYSGKVNIYFFGVFFTAALWILFVHYPFGVLNPGSAVRYRESFYAFLVVLFYFSYIKNYRPKVNNKDI